MMVRLVGELPPLQVLLAPLKLALTQLPGAALVDSGALCWVTGGNTAETILALQFIRYLQVPSSMNLKGRLCPQDVGASHRRICAA